MAQGQRSVSVAELKAECTALERAVRHANLATEAELEPWRPGGESNSRKDARGYLIFYARLHRFHARGEMKGSEEDRLRADANVMSALRDEPIRVDLLTPIIMHGDEGTAHTVNSLLVYQKSIDALFHVHALDRQLGWLLIQRERVEEAGARGMPKASELLTRITETVSYTYGLLVWIMTSPGPQMPYDPSIRGDPELPEYVQALHPLDVNQIAQAAMEHHARLASVQVLLETRSNAQGGRRPSWSQFVGTLAVELKSDTVQISRYKSLGSLLAMVQLDADAKRPDDAEAASDPAAGTLA